MTIQNVPEIFLKPNESKSDLYVHDFKMSDDVFKSKVNLNLHMFSFLQNGKKQVHFSDSSVAVNNEQSLLIKRGNCLWSELLDEGDVYYCKLLFFSESRLIHFLKKQNKFHPYEKKSPSYFVIENDDFIHSYLNSLSLAQKKSQGLTDRLLSERFDELMLYLVSKYDKAFINYVQSFIANKDTKFKNVVEKNMYSNLNVDEIAFLCHMSLSTFKRRFVKEYNSSPGKWLQDKRLTKAKELIESGKRKSTEIYMDFGYNNLSNFSAAFKNKFGKSPNLLKV